jgi:energy-converting hydrogenase Eha subunit F
MFGVGRKLPKLMSQPAYVMEIFIVHIAVAIIFGLITLNSIRQTRQMPSPAPRRNLTVIR